MIDCNKHHELVYRWSQESQRLAAAVGELAEKITSLSKEEFHILRVQAEDARLASENARLAIDLHCLEHRCGCSRLYLSVNCVQIHENLLASLAQFLSRVGMEFGDGVYLSHRVRTPWSVSVAM